MIASPSKVSSVSTPMSAHSLYTRSLAKAIHPDQTLTPNNLRDLVDATLMEAHIRRATPEFFSELMALTLPLVTHLRTLECTARVQKLLVIETPERVPPPLEPEITDFLCKIQDLRTKISEKLLLLAECKEEDTTVS